MRGPESSGVRPSRTAARHAFRRARIGALLVAALLLASGAAAHADDGADPGAEIAITAEVGHGGELLTGHWLPVWVRLTNRGAGVEGRVIAEVESPGGESDRTERPVELPSRSTKVVWLYVRTRGSVEAMRVRFMAAGRTWEASPPKFRQASGASPVVIGLLGPAPTRADALDSLEEPRPTVLPLLPEQVPDRWIGYDAFEAVVVTQAGAACFGSEAQARAFGAWVRAGGTAVIVASRGVDAVRGTVFEELLPARLGAMVDRAPGDGLPRFASEEAAGVPPLPSGAESAPGVAGGSGSAIGVLMSTVESSAGAVLASDAGRPLIIDGRCGLGRVVLLTFDPWAAPVAGWAGMPEVWRRCLAGERWREVSPAIDVVGGDPAQMGDLAALTRAGARVRSLTPEQLPTDVSGYENTDWLIVARASREVFARPEQEAAAREWVGRGGHLLVVAAEGGSGLRGSALDRWTGGRLCDWTQTLRSAEWVRKMAGSVPARVTGYSASIRIEVPNSRSYSDRYTPVEAGVPLSFLAPLQEYHCVRFLTFDPWAPPFAHWPPMRRFWRELDWNKCPPDHGHDRIVHDSSARELLAAKPVGSRLVILFLLYLLLQGPVEWWLLRRAQRPGWRWAGAPLWACAFAVAAWITTSGSSQPRIVTWQVTRVDLDGTTGAVAAHTEMGAFTAAGGRFDVLGDAPVDGIAAWENLQVNSGPLPSGGGLVWDQAEANVLRVDTVGAGELRLFAADRYLETSPGQGIRAATTPAGLTLKNESTFVIEDLHLLAEDVTYIGLGRIESRETRQVLLTDAQATVRSRADRPAKSPGRDAFYERLRSTAWSPESGLAREVTGLMIADAGRAGRWLRGGGKILIGRIAWNPCRLRIAGLDPEPHELCVLRIFYR
ncbi:MAG: hypothetical protein HZA54_13680 [Planctomycetes bacterium]|nr:hypothetical protein [Planctomycetota bacterium]